MRALSLPPEVTYRSTPTKRLYVAICLRNKDGSACAQYVTKVPANDVIFRLFRVLWAPPFRRLTRNKEIDIARQAYNISPDAEITRIRLKRTRVHYAIRKPGTWKSGDVSDTLGACHSGPCRDPFGLRARHDYAVVLLTSSTRTSLSSVKTWPTPELKNLCSAGVPGSSRAE